MKAKVPVHSKISSKPKSTVRAMTSDSIKSCFCALLSLKLGHCQEISKHVGEGDIAEVQPLPDHHAHLKSINDNCKEDSNTDICIQQWHVKGRNEELVVYSGLFALYAPVVKVTLFHSCTHFIRLETKLNHSNVQTGHSYF